MARTILEDVSEELINIFTKCDEIGSGVVEINSLISALTSQDPVWLGDENIEEEFRKVLCVNESNLFITKEDFIRLLLEWFQASFLHENDTQQKGELCLAEDNGRCSSLSSGFGGSTESTTSSSMNSLDENLTTVYFVSDGQTAFAENTDGEISVASSESPCTKNKLTIAMKNEINSLQQKNEYLETVNNSLAVQISSLEDVIVRYEKESKSNHKKLLDFNQVLEEHKQKQEETVERLGIFIEENKSVTIQLSQSERENNKLKDYVSQLKEQVDKISVEKKNLYNKLQDIKQRFKTLNDLYNKTQDEFRTLQTNEVAKKEALEKMVQKNRNLQSQLESSDTLIQELKYELSAITTEFTNLKKAQINNKLGEKNESGDLSSESSMVVSDKTDCCFCMKNILFPSTSDVCVGTEYSSTFDVAVGADEKMFIDTAMMTEFFESQDYKTNTSVAMSKDVGVNCCIKDSIASKNITDTSIKVCNLKPKRSSKRRRLLWPILLLLGFLLGISSSLITIIYIYIVCPKPCIFFSYILELLHISIKYADLPY